MLTGHLAEDLKGELKFIERAVGVGRAKALYESESGEPIGVRELSRRLAKDGYPISASHVSRMLDTLQHLLPSIPGLLYSGLGVDRITKILSLRKTSFTCWEKHYTGEGVDFEMLFQDVLAQFEGEAEEFLYQRFQDELIGTMKKSLPLGYEDILLEITQQQDQLRRSTPVVQLPTNDPLPAAGLLQSAPSEKPAPSPQGSTAPGNNQPSRQNTSQSNSGPNEPGSPSPEMQARIDGHIASPVTQTARVIEMKKKLAAIEGEQLPDFNSNCLQSIPVQAGGLNPISDLWYIEREIDSSEQLRKHIAQLALEIQESVNAPGQITEIPAGIGYSYRQPTEESEVTATAVHTMTLLQSLSGAVSIALQMIRESPDADLSSLEDFEFAAGLGQLLIGQPSTKDIEPHDQGRINDGALVKLFRIIRLARRLIDIEIKQSA
ncbi:ParB-like nuclease domain containing protein [Pseudomonas sessilinigenes]|nr:ParB-like nuclease domain containing protein [Pseudomonas sessilinigenes]